MIHVRLYIPAPGRSVFWLHWLEHAVLHGIRETPILDLAAAQASTPCRPRGDRSPWSPLGATRPDLGFVRRSVDRLPYSLFLAGRLTDVFFFGLPILDRIESPTAAVILRLYSDNGIDLHRPSPSTTRHDCLRRTWGAPTCVVADCSHPRGLLCRSVFVVIARTSPTTSPSTPIYASSSAPWHDLRLHRSDQPI
jgi:hypothetical protein